MGGCGTRPNKPHKTWLVAELRQSSPSSHFVSALRLAARGFESQTRYLLNNPRPQAGEGARQRGWGAAYESNLISKAAKSSNVFKFTNASVQSLKSTSIYFWFFTKYSPCARRFQYTLASSATHFFSSNKTQDANFHRYSQRQYPRGLQP